MAEYEALLGGLRIAIETGIKRHDVRGDSQLVIDQVMKNVSCHDEKMEAYLKDRLGDQRGGSEWEPIKILLERD
jgi:ribonuclease HI